MAASLTGTQVTVSLCLCSLLHLLLQSFVVLMCSLTPVPSSHNSNFFHFLSLLCWAKRCLGGAQLPQAVLHAVTLSLGSSMCSVQKRVLCQHGSTGQFERVPLAQLWLHSWIWMGFKLFDLIRKLCLFWGLLNRLSNSLCTQTLSYCQHRCLLINLRVHFWSLESI